MKKILQLSLLAATALSASHVFAASPTWDLVELDYVVLDLDDTNLEPTGFGLSAVKLVSDNVFLTGSYVVTDDSLSINSVPADIDLDISLDYDTLDLGVGYKHSITENTDWYANVSYVRVEAKTRFSSAEENGYGVATGIRSMMTDNVELAAELSYADIDVDDETSFGIQGTYYVTENVGINLGFSTSSDAKAYDLGVRYAF